MQNSFAEVMESSLQTFIGQCWQWNSIPTFGSLVTITQENKTIFGIIYQIQTGSSDPVRYPFPYKKTPEELMAEQPQIFEFLKTTFACVALGYQEKSKIFYLIPEKPPPIHSFISTASTQEIKFFFSNKNYLPLLFNTGTAIPCLDELLLAILKQQAKLAMLTDTHMNEFISSFSLLSGNDYRRLKLFLQRVETIL